MFAYIWQLLNVGDWAARRIQASASLLFGSALALAFANILVLWLTGDWLGRFMNPLVGIMDLLWIFLTIRTLHRNTGIAVKAGLLGYKETRRLLMGFLIVEAATALFFFLIPLPLWLTFPLLIAILMWYLSAKMIGKPFNWNNFRVPAIWATVIILIIGLLMSFGFFGHREIRDPSQVGPYIKGLAKAGTEAVSAAWAERQEEKRKERKEKERQERVEKERREKEAKNKPAPAPKSKAVPAAVPQTARTDRMQLVPVCRVGGNQEILVYVKDGFPIPQNARFVAKANGDTYAQKDCWPPGARKIKWSPENRWPFVDLYVEIPEDYNPRSIGFGPIYNLTLAQN